jgi:manganese transport protein
MLERDPATPVSRSGPGRARIVSMIGPAFVAAVAYIDPGNFATNITAGARFGYTLVWVIVIANLMAMLVQYLSAKLGVATGRDLPDCVVNTCPAGSRSDCGCRPNWWPWPPTWPSSSGPRSA